MTLQDEYKKIDNSNTNIINRYPKSFIPQPNETDYIRSYIIRYFLQLKTNIRNPIIEVNEAEYKRISSESITLNSSMFLSMSLRWKISGDREDVINKNTKTLSIKENILHGISLRLGNRLQFWK